MDDSVDNRVLVKKEYNAKKTDVYPIAADIRRKMSPFWKKLLDNKLISKKKYDRLVRTEELTPEELAGFIDRQLVETRQSTKVVAEILKEAFPDTEIVYVKAGNVSNFRHMFDIVKVRELNDLHHAKDAYLNIVVGNAYYVKFNKNAAWFIKENPGRSYNLKRMFDYDIRRNNEVAWLAGSTGTISQVKNMVSKNHILVTRKSYEVTGGLFDQQLMKKGKGQVPVKTSDERLGNIEKYGGYNKASGAYFMLVKSKNKKGEEQRTIEYVPIYLKHYIEESKENALDYLKNERKLNEPEILLDKIKKDTLFRVNGFYMCLSKRTGKQLAFKGANELLLPEPETLLLKKITKYIQRRKESKDLKLTKQDNITEKELLELYDVFTEKLNHSVYAVCLGTQGKTLVQKKPAFVALPVEEKCIVLSEILHLFQCQSGSANLKLIGGPASAGILYLNSNISDAGEILIINQSPSGIFEKRIDLLRL